MKLHQIFRCAAIVVCLLFSTGQTSAAENQVVQSEKLNFTLSTVASGFGIPWAMAFLPNGDLLVTDRDGELRLSLIHI